MKRFLYTLGALLVVYVLSYGVFRNMNIETWEKDGKRYVIFPRSQVWIYYLYRPMTYLDSMATGMNFHIGPHHDHD
jgi:hypothetical protein